MVGRIGREEAAWSNCAPNGTGVEVGAREGARETVDGIFGAYAADVGESPVQHTDLCESCDTDRDQLDNEKLARRYLNIC